MAIADTNQMVKYFMFERPTRCSMEPILQEVEVLDSEFER